MAREITGHDGVTWLLLLMCHLQAGEKGMRAKLTKRAVEAFKPSEKDVIVWVPT